MKYRMSGEKTFTLVKTLLNRGVTIKEVTDMTGKSLPTVECISRSSDYSEYRKNFLAENQAERLKKANGKMLNGLSSVPNIVEVLLQVKAVNERMESDIREIKEMVKKEVNKNVFHYPDVT